MLDPLRRLRKMIGRKTLTAVALVIGLFVGFILITFPGRQAPLALTLTTGWNMPALQARIDTLEERVIHNQPLADDDPAFRAGRDKTLAQARSSDDRCSKGG